VPTWPLTAGWFVESGKVWNGLAYAKASDGSLQAIPSSYDTLSSSGFDLAFTSTDKIWNAKLQWAHAIGGRKPADGNNGGHTWLTIGMSF
jgi:hypothetical protein